MTERSICCGDPGTPRSASTSPRGEESFADIAEDRCRGSIHALPSGRQGTAAFPEDSILLGSSSDPICERSRSDYEEIRTYRLIRPSLALGPACAFCSDISSLTFLSLFSLFFSGIYIVRGRCVLRAQVASDLRGLRTSQSAAISCVHESV